MLSTTLTLALALGAPAPAGVELQWSLKPGTVIYSISEAVLDQIIEVMGETIKQKQEFSTKVRFTVKPSKAKETVIEMTYLETKLAGPEGVDLSAVMEAFKGATLTATLNEKLEVTKIDGREKLIKDLCAGDSTKETMFTSLLSDASLKQTFSTMFAVTPKQILKVGDTWNRTDEVPAGTLGKFTSKGKFKLEKVEGDLATIEQTAELTFEAGNGAGLPVKISNLDFKVEKFTGKSIFDVKAGRLKESLVEIKMSGKMTIEAGGQKVDAVINQTAKTINTFMDKNPVKN